MSADDCCALTFDSCLALAFFRTVSVIISGVRGLVFHVNVSSRAVKMQLCAKLFLITDGLDCKCSYLKFKNCHYSYSVVGSKNRSKEKKNLPD